MTRRMLLFAALLLGIFAMHTVGHPAGGGHQDMRPAAMERTSEPSGHAEQAQRAEHPGQSRRSEQFQHDASHPAAAMAPAAAAMGAHPPEPAHRPAHGMSPLTVCLAVLGAATVALLALRLLLGGPGLASAAARSLLPRRGRRWTPPLWISLSALPVLRI